MAGSLVARFQAALRGVGAAFRKPEVIGHLVLGLLTVVLGLLACLSRTEWGLVLLAIGGVLTAEIANTALEELASALSPARKPGVRRAKDLAAAAVLVAAASAFLVGLLVLVPPWLSGRAGSCLLSVVQAA